MVPLHGIASRHDLPLPFGFVVAGAAAALALSFVLLAFAWRRPRLTARHGVPLPAIARVWDNPGVRWVLRALVLAAYVIAAIALFAGEDLLTNPVFGFVYAVLWVGLVPVSLLLGPIWRALNPI